MFKNTPILRSAVRFTHDIDLTNRDTFEFQSACITSELVGRMRGFGKPDTV